MSKQKEDLTGILAELHAEYSALRESAQAARAEVDAAHKRRDEANAEAARVEHSANVAANNAQHHHAKIKHVQDALSKLGEA